MVMGGDEVRFPALQTKTIQATLFNTAMSIRAQKMRASSSLPAPRASMPISSKCGLLSTSQDKIKQNPENLSASVRGALKGLNYYVSKRESAIKYMMDGLRMRDRELVSLDL